MTSAPLIKLIFLASILLQVMIWPSVASICFVTIYGLLGIINYFALKTGKVMEAFMDPGVYIFRDEKRTSNFVIMLVMALYFVVHLILFISHEVDILPAATLWLDRSFAGNYSSHVYSKLPIEVTDGVSKEMRAAPFVWSKSLVLQAPLITGTIPSAGPEGRDLVCNPGAGLGYRCFGKIWANDAPAYGVRDTNNNAFVPLSSDYYNIDVKISPGQGKRCSDLEVYRLVINHERAVINPLDYPASTIPLSTTDRSPLQPAACNLFNLSSAFCLQTQHTFSPSKYLQEVAALCNRFDQRLIFRLPERTKDVDPDSGKHALDILLVSDSVASVELHASWKKKPRSEWFLFFSATDQVVDSDQLQGWRESYDSVDVFFKFAIAATPLAITWYYLCAEYIYHYFHDGQIIFLSVFIQMPSILLFLSMGAWLPMAGCIICVLAVNHEVNRQASPWRAMIRPSLLFLTAVSNSIQFAWLLALVGQAGWNAFFYALTLDQLYLLSYKFIITNQSSPSWVAIMLPVTLMVNAAFLVGSAICIVLETMAGRKPKA
jgi:hypothetical protein